MTIAITAAIVAVLLLLTPMGVALLLGRAAAKRAQEVERLRTLYTTGGRAALESEGWSVRRWADVGSLVEGTSYRKGGRAMHVVYDMMDREKAPRLEFS